MSTLIGYHFVNSKLSKKYKYNGLHFFNYVHLRLVSGFFIASSAQTKIFEGQCCLIHEPTKRYMNNINLKKSKRKPISYFAIQLQKPLVVKSYIRCRHCFISAMLSNFDASKVSE